MRRNCARVRTAMIAWNRNPRSCVLAETQALAFLNSKGFPRDGLASSDEILRATH
jgi:hypothetical protein